MRSWQTTVALLCALAAGAPADLRAQQQPATLADLHFLSGCWRQGGEGRSGLEEVYSNPSDNLMLGFSRFLRDGRAVDFEFSRIDQTAEGPVLTPHPKGVASVPFRATSLQPARVVWENPAHDFPQRIIYHRVAADTLVARIEGTTPSGERVLEWRLARVACPASP